jgi:hypothetical protein
MTDLALHAGKFKKSADRAAQLTVGMSYRYPDPWRIGLAGMWQLDLERLPAPRTAQRQTFPGKLFPVNPEAGCTGRTSDNHAIDLGGGFTLRRESGPSVAGPVSAQK